MERQRSSGWGLGAALSCDHILGKVHCAMYPGVRSLRRKCWSPVYVLRADSVSLVTRLTGPAGNRRVFKGPLTRAGRHGTCLVS